MDGGRRREPHVTLGDRTPLAQPSSATFGREEEIHEALAQARGYLRTAVAEAICRKKTPHLIIRFRRR